MEREHERAGDGAGRVRVSERWRCNPSRLGGEVLCLNRE